MKTQSILSIAIKLVLTLIVLLAIYAGAGFYIVPMWLKHKIPDLIQQETGRKAAIEKLELDPFFLRLKLQGVQMQEQDGSPFISFDGFYLHFDAWKSLQQKALVFDKLSLHKPFVHVIRQKNGVFNFIDLIKFKEPVQPKDSKMIPVNISKLSITDGLLAWDDEQHEQPVSEVITPFNVEFEDFTTQAGKTFPLAFSLTLQSGGELHWQGKAGINPFISEGHVKLDKLKLESIRKLALQVLPFDFNGESLLDLDYKVRYVDNNLNLDIQQSKLVLRDVQVSVKEAREEPITAATVALEGAYQLSYADNKLNLDIQQSKLAIRDVRFAAQEPGKVAVKIPTVTLDGGYAVSYAGDQLNVTGTQGKFDIQGFQLSATGQDKALIKIPAASGRGIGFNLKNRSLAVDSVTAKDADIQAWLNADGVMNYLTLFAAENSEASTANNGEDKSVKTQQKPWNIKIQKLVLANGGLAFEDRTVKKPLLISFSPIDLQLTGFTNQAGARLPVELSVGVNKTGSIKLVGETVLEPLSTQLAVAFKNIDLEKFQPYFNKVARLDIIDGQLAAEGEANVARSENDQLDVRFKGNAGIVSLLTRDQLQNKDFIKWEKLSLLNLDVDLLASNYSADALHIYQPYARVVINKDKTINFSDILQIDKNTAPAVKNKTAETTQGKKPQFKLGKLQVIDGSSYFADLSLILPFKARIKDINGGARGISSEAQAMVQVLLTGNAYDLSPVEIKGDISPYRGDYNIEMSFKGMPMPLVSPYMVEFAGYKVEKGKLTLDLKYNVAKAKLTASNNILIDQFELGEKVDNPQAASLPMELAVALLKDGDGNIKIDVPITGSLEDPQFSMGAIITDALVNAITKVVTAPFNAIASWVGTKEDLSRVNFVAGKAELDEEQKTKLLDLAKALNDRTELILEIKGAAFEEQDWPALTKDALYDQLKKIRAAEINKEGGAKIRSEYVKLSDDEYKRLLADLFIEKFPMLAEKSWWGSPQLLDPNAGDFYEVAQQKLESVIAPEEKRLKELASERAQTIAKYIVQQGSVSNERVYILDTAIDPVRGNNEIVVTLSLKIK